MRAITRSLVLAIVAGLASGTSGLARDSLAGRPMLLRSDDSEVSIRVVFPAPGPDTTIAGLPHHRIVGAPALPFQSALVTIPPGATVRLVVEDDRPRLLAGREVPIFETPVSDADDLAPIATDPPRDRPFENVEIDFDGFLRDRRVVRLIFHPLTPDPLGRGIVHHPVLTARLVLDPPSGKSVFGHELSVRPAESRPRPSDRAVRDLYARTILNEHSVNDDAYHAALAEFAPASASLPGSFSGVLEASGSGGGPLPAKIPVRGEGIWSVTHADLLAAGIDAGGTSSTALSLSSGGTAVPFRVIDGGDGTFDPGDRVELHGTGIAGQIEYHTNVYRLAFDEGPGTAMSIRNAAPAGGASPTSFVDTRRFEQNLVFFTTHADSDGDRIGWQRLTGSGSGNATASYTFTLPDVDPLATSIRVRARVYHLGGTHTTSVLLNGVDLMDSRSWSTGDVTHDVTTSASNLVPGTNTLTLQLSGSASNQVVFNWFEVEYPRLYRAENDALIFTSGLAAPVAHQVSAFSTPDIVVYDVTDPAAPVLLEALQVMGAAGNYSASFTETLGGSRRFIARAGTASPGGTILADQPSTLRDASNGADLIVLAYRDFVDELEPLVDAREAQGFRVALVDLEDVFDEFAFGRPDPSAIKAFLAEAYGLWQPPAPAFLLLVGNATLDPRQQLADSVPPLMPTGTFIAPTVGLAASDNALVTIVGSDPLPDMFVGRIPAQTEGQVADVVAKTVAYDDVPPGLLNQRILLSADNDDLVFETTQEDLVTLYLAGTRIAPERAYLRLLGTTATNQKIRSTINLGALTASFLGHGNVHNWAAENVFVDTVDLPLLTNSDRPTFLTTLNCINGFHAGPRGTSIDSLAELALLAPNGGAIGVWSPSALALLSDYQRISEVLYRLLFVERQQTLGVATTLAKIEAYTMLGSSVANLDEMHLFGDPTVVLRVDGDLDDLLDLEEDTQGLDPRDADSDDDGLPDGAEPFPFADSDGDGRLDALDHDADDDGLPDGLESGIVVPGPDTDPDRGHFVADAHAASTTDPTDPDTDGGGAPDGAEDRNANGQVDPGETDPQNPADDPACSPGPPLAVAGLVASKSGEDVLLAWVDQSSTDPCVLYRVHVATNADPPAQSAFVTEAVTTLPGFSHRGTLNDANLYFYRVTTTSPIAGEGP